MKAAVLYGAHDMRIEEVPDPVAEPGGVVVKVKACGICGSDVPIFKNGPKEPMRLGHEFAGDVVAVGDGLKDVKEGDRVAATSGRGCGECYWCRRGDWLRCKKLSILGYGIPGAFAEYVAVPNFELGRYAVKLPDGLSYEQGATAEPLAVALYAVEQTQPKPDDHVAVIGLGIIGLAIIQVLRAHGVKNIVASGRRAGRLELAGQSGAAVVVDAATADVPAAVEAATGGRGADIVYECAGTTAGFNQALELVHKGGVVNVVGIYKEPIEWNPNSIVNGDLTLIGCGLRFDLPGAVKLMQAGRADMRPLITHTFPLAQTGAAFEAQLGAPDAIKVLVLP
jgi:threonine dehydrogenase-like Zn-dependent dehydrogenase